MQSSSINMLMVILFTNYTCWNWNRQWSRLSFMSNRKYIGCSTSKVKNWTVRLLETYLRSQNHAFNKQNITESTLVTHTDSGQMLFHSMLSIIQDGAKCRLVICQHWRYIYIGRQWWELSEMAATVSLTVAAVAHRVCKIHEVTGRCKLVGAGRNRHKAEEHERPNQWLCKQHRSWLHHNWETPVVASKSFCVSNTSTQQPGFDLPRRSWSLPNHFLTGQGQCRANSAGLVTSKSNALHAVTVTSYSHQKVTSYLISYFLKIIVTSYFKK